MIFSATLALFSSGALSASSFTCFSAWYTKLSACKGKRQQSVPACVEQTIGAD